MTPAEREATLMGWRDAAKLINTHQDIVIKLIPHFITELIRIGANCEEGSTFNYYARAKADAYRSAFGL